MQLPTQYALRVGICGCPKVRGNLFGGPYNKDFSICGSVLGSP